MKFHAKDIFHKARTLKQQGLAVNEITEQLRISKGTLSRWCFDMPSTNFNQLRHQKLKLEIKKRGTEAIKGLRLDKQLIKLCAALIYWGEGYKYPNCNYIGIANSDVQLIRTFLELFRLGFEPKEEKFKVHLQLHETHDKKDMTSFWSQALNIPQEQFYKPTITAAQNKRKRQNYRGTCTIRYYDFAVYQEITGIYEAFSRKII